MAHLGNEANCSPWTYKDVITHTSGIDAFLDGHSHDTDQVVVKDRDGKDVPRTACGTQMACIGWCRIAAEQNQEPMGLTSRGFFFMTRPM